MSQDQTELQQLAHIALDKARQSGADAAEVGCSRSSGLEATVRQGETDNLQFSRDNAISISVYFGKRKGSASCGDSTAESIVQSVEKACAIARYAEEDPACGLADADAMATEFPDLDTFHPYALTAEAAIARATLIEDAARADQRIVNSEGASVSSEAHSRSVPPGLGSCLRDSLSPEAADANTQRFTTRQACPAAASLAQADRAASPVSGSLRRRKKRPPDSVGVMIRTGPAKASA